MLVLGCDPLTFFFCPFSFLIGQEFYGSNFLYFFIYFLYGSNYPKC